MGIKQKLRRVPLVRRWFAYEEQKAALAHDTYSIAQLAKLDIPFFPWTVSSLRPSSIRLLVNEICIHQRHKFLEFGSGISTLYFAEMAKKYGGMLVSVEQNLEWIEIVKGYLRQSNTEDFVEFIHAPIVPLPAASLTSEWYDREVLSSILGDRKFDLILVDAPISRARHFHARLPAGEFIENYLEEDFAIFLDDIHRKGEQQIAQRWREQFGWSLKVYWPVASVVVFRPTASQTFNIS